MKSITETRLRELKAEFESGRKIIADLEARQVNLKTTLLRISGAIQVLEELLGRDTVVQENSGTPSASERETAATR